MTAVAGAQAPAGTVPSTALRATSTRSSRAPSTPADRRVPGRLYVGTSGFAYPGWIPRFYPTGLRASEFLRALRVAPARGRAEQHLLRLADRRQGRGLGRRHARRLPVRRQGPARRLVPRAPGGSGRGRAVADRAVPGVRGAARDRPVPRPRRRPARRREAGRDARGVAGRPAPDDGVPGPVVARRRDVRRAGRRRCGAVRDRAARGQRAADPPPDRAVPVPAAAPPRLRRAEISRPGPRGSSRSWRRATTRSCSSATTRPAVAPELAVAFRDGRGRASPARAVGRGRPRRVRTRRAARGARRCRGSGAGRRPRRRPANRARPGASPPRP